MRVPCLKRVPLSLKRVPLSEEGVYLKRVPLSLKGACGASL